MASILLDWLRRKPLTQRRPSTPKKSTVDRIIAFRVFIESLHDVRTGPLAACVLHIRLSIRLYVGSRLGAPQNFIMNTFSENGTKMKEVYAQGRDAHPYTGSLIRPSTDRSQSTFVTNLQRVEHAGPRCVALPTLVKEVECSVFRTLTLPVLLYLRDVQLELKERLNFFATMSLRRILKNL